MNDELWARSAIDLAAGIRAKDFSATEVLEATFSRIDALNPDINAIVDECRDEARVTAKEADAAVSRGDELDVLHGVPATSKINVDQVGHATSNGLPAFRDVIADQDAPVVRNLRAAGAVIIGRTNTPEMSLRAMSGNPLHGRTKNPWSEEASPGGSSGGAAAAAAAGFGPVHHGTDIGGSLRLPSFACGVSTVKPTQGRVPAWNPSATVERGMLSQLMSMQGAICRHVADVRLALGVMARADARDPWWVPAPFSHWPAEDKPIVALCKDAHGYPIDAEIVACLDRAASILETAGYRVEEPETPSIAEPAQAWMDVLLYEIRETLDPVVREHGSKELQKILDWCYKLGDLVDADGYINGIADRTRMTRTWNQFLDQYPLVLTPFMMRPWYPWNYDTQGFEQNRELWNSLIYSNSVNYLGLPAGFTPVGYADGLPAGVQIIGRRFREDQILDAMQVLQDEVGLLTDELWSRTAG